MVGSRKTILSVLLLGSFSLGAKDLGTIGTTYPIIERDLIEVMMGRAQEKIDNGELDELHDEMRDNTKQYVKTPPGISLPRTVQYRAVEINPVYTVPQDITDANGKVLFKAGMTVNPLEVKPLNKMLCFIDGTDEEQVAWMLRFCTDNPQNKLILINGNYAELSEKYNLRLYFDQEQRLINRFEIQNVPAVIRQSGKVLYLEEFPTT